MNDKTIIDLSYLLSASENKDFLLKMFDIFKTTVPEIRLLLSVAYENADYKSLSEYAHKLKSPISILGMSGTKLKIEMLERDAKEQINVDTYGLIIEDIFDDCFIAIQEIIDFEQNIK